MRWYDFFTSLNLSFVEVTTEKGLELARISLVDFDFNVIYDEFILPENPILDYNTKFSGITPEILSKATGKLKDAQRNFLRLVDDDTILVGHSLENDLNALQVHPL